jgi:hypothetical protein
MGNRCYSTYIIIHSVPTKSENNSLPNDPNENTKEFIYTNDPSIEKEVKQQNIIPFEKKLEYSWKRRSFTFFRRNDLPKDFQKETSSTISCHIRKMSNHYTINYPDHKKRVETTIFRHTRKELENVPCFICGKCKSEDNISNEIHHFYIQKVASSAIDWYRFGEFANNCYNIQTGELLGDKFDWKEVEQNPDLFVDSPYNMIVLCKNHHTGRCGIHHIPFPDWILQKFAVDGFKFVV